MSLDLAHLDRVAVAVKHQLRDSPELVAWAGGAGRVVRVGNLATVDGLPPREIAVGTVAAEPVFEPNDAAQVAFVVGLRFVWEETRRLLDDAEPTIAAVVDLAWRQLRANAHLVRTETGGRPLARRLETYRPVDYRAVREEGSTVQLSLVLAVEYRARVHLTTWEVIP